MMIRTMIAVLILLMFSFNNLRADDYDSAKKLKKLFTTPAQRDELDKRRKAGVFDSESNMVSEVFNRASDVELKGIVYRKGKRPVVWVNDKNTIKNTRVDSNIRVYGVEKSKKSDQAKLIVNDNVVRLKPGQVWSDFDGKARDKFQIKSAD